MLLAFLQQIRLRSLVPGVEVAPDVVVVLAYRLHARSADEFVVPSAVSLLQWGHLQ